MKNKLMFLAIIVISQAGVGQQTILDQYIKIALETNLLLQQKQGSYEKSLQVLKEARGMFLPNVSINARYTRAEGGRTIEFPVGDMLNPVYSTLNALSQLNGLVNTTTGQTVYFINPATGQPIQFPQIENQEFAFYREKEHETKVRVVQPILNNQIYYNNKIKKELAGAEKFNFEAYQRQLVCEVKTAYYGYIQTIEVLELIDETEILLNENVRVNQKLFENNMVTIDYVYRSKSELDKLGQTRAEGIKNHKMAKSYFNFLLNQDLNTDITIDSTILSTHKTLEIENMQNQALLNREEIKQVERYQEVNNNLIKLNKTNTLPAISGVLDYGFQGEKYEFTNEYDYMMGSLVLQWDLFKGLQNKHKIEQSKIEQAILEKKMEELKQQILLQTINAYFDLEAASAGIETSNSVLTTSKKAFEIIQKKFNQGQSPLIEYIDARTSYTNAKQNLILANYSYQIKLAELERVACLFPLNHQ